MQNFFIYMFVDHNTGKPVYVGKGSGKRDSQHELLAQRKRGRLYNWMRKYHKLNHVWPKPFRIFEGLTEGESLVFEKSLIGFYGRLDLKTGSLFNLTDGGEGTSGHVVTEGTKAKISTRLKEIRRTIPPGNKGKRESSEACAKKAAALRGRVPWNKGIATSPEALRKISLALRGKVNKGRVCSDEHRRNLSAAQRRRREMERLTIAA